MRERKDLIVDFNEETGLEECFLTHTRVIGDRSFTTKRSITSDDDEEKEESIETEMDDSELENFKDEWEMIRERPKPSMSQSVCNFCGTIQEIEEPGRTHYSLRLVQIFPDCNFFWNFPRFLMRLNPFN